MRRFLIGSIAAIGIAVIVVLGWTDHVRVGTIDVPMPSPMISLGGQDWIVLGRPDVAKFLADASPAAGWAFGEQLGSMCTLHRDGHQAQITWRIVGSVFTRVNVALTHVP